MVDQNELNSTLPASNCNIIVCIFSQYLPPSLCVCSPLRRPPSTFTVCRWRCPARRTPATTWFRTSSCTWATSTVRVHNAQCPYTPYNTFILLHSSQCVDYVRHVLVSGQLFYAGHQHDVVRSSAEGNCSQHLTRDCKTKNYNNLTVNRKSLTLIHLRFPKNISWSPICIFVDNQNNKLITLI